MPAGVATLTDRRAPALLLVMLLCAIVAIYYETLSSIVSTWYAVNAYHHGFLILPICLFLLWQERQAFNNVSPAPSWSGVLLLAALSFSWLLSELAGIQVLKQYFVVAMVPASVASIYGWATVEAFRFPLLYLLLAVPFGEFLLPYMVDFTAGFAVDALSLLQIPVYRDGRYFYIPSGSFEVAEACGGLKYFISTLALALLYSYFLFVSASKKLLFVAFALFLSVVTNGIRATSVVLLLHYTDLDIARGKDHEFVGWILFGLMLAVLLWIGNRFADIRGGRESMSDSSSRESLQSATSRSRQRLAIVAPFSVAALSMGAALGMATEPGTLAGEFRGSGLPTRVEGWVVDTPEDTAWQPSYSGYTQMALGRYQRGNSSVDVALIQYATLRQGAEITSATNAVADPAQWRLGNVLPAADFLDAAIVREVRGNASHESRLFWYWIDVNGTSFDGVLRTKMAEIRNVISGIPNVSSAIILSTPISGSEEDSQKLLADFVTPFYEQLHACMAGIASSHACFPSKLDPKDS